MSENNLYDYPAAAEYLGLSPFTLRRYVCERKIDFLKLGPRLVRFKKPMLDRFIEARTFNAIER